MWIKFNPNPVPRCIQNEKVEEIWRARNEASHGPHENNSSSHHHCHHHHNHNHNHHHEDMVVGEQLLGSGGTASGTLRWGVVRHTPPLSASAPSGGVSVASAPLREATHGTGKGKAVRHAKEEQVHRYCRTRYPSWRQPYVHFALATARSTIIILHRNFDFM